MSDYIKREDALNASKLVYIECIEKDDGGFLEVDADNIPIVLKRDIMELPAADVVERKMGKWIGGELGHCSCCGHEGCASDIWNDGQINFCPNCGAEMERINDV